MAKFNTWENVRKTRGSSPLRAEVTSGGKTHEGGTGFARDPKSELYLRATSSFAGEDSFYEQAMTRDERVRELVRSLAVNGDWDWLRGFLPWLRHDGNMRTAPLMLAAEAVHARLEAKLHGGNRQLVASVLDRADEPGEIIAYWFSRFGRNLPVGFKRGIADAVPRLYTDYSMLKYDTEGKAIRFGDVLDLTHPRPSTPADLMDWLPEGKLEGMTAEDVKAYIAGARDAKGQLYSYALARRHGYPEPVPARLSMVRAERDLRRKVENGDFTPLTDPAALRSAGFTWQDSLSLAGDNVPKKDLWEALVPSMPYMALLRNLRNFDQAGVDAPVARYVQDKLRDPGQVQRSRQFPFRFLSAYINIASVRWSEPLEEALGLSCANIPALDGRTLVLIDTSGSMQSPLSDPKDHPANKRRRKKRDDEPEPARPWNVTVGALFGFALAARNPGKCDVYGFANADRPFRQECPPGMSVLKAVDVFSKRIGEDGHGTQIAEAVRKTYDRHDRVVVFTDGQTFEDTSYGIYGGYGADVAASVPGTVPVYAWNLAGYGYSCLSGQPNRHELGGFTDSCFRMIPLIEAGLAAKWPWEVAQGGAGE